MRHAGGSYPGSARVEPDGAIFRLLPTFAGDNKNQTETRALGMVKKCVERGMRLVLTITVKIQATGDPKRAAPQALPDSPKQSLG